MKTYPKGFLLLVWVIITLMTISGLMIIPKAMDLRFTIALPYTFPDNLVQNMRIFHAAISFIYIAVFGALWASHMRLGWRKKANLKSGVSMVIISILLLASATVFYYAMDDNISNGASLVHIAFGIMMPIILLLHYQKRKQLALKIV